jgi:hypothetical protein
MGSDGAHVRGGSVRDAGDGTGRSAHASQPATRSIVCSARMGPAHDKKALSERDICTKARLGDKRGRPHHTLTRFRR